MLPGDTLPQTQAYAQVPGIEETVMLQLCNTNCWFIMNPLLATGKTGNSKLCTQTHPSKSRAVKRVPWYICHHTVFSHEKHRIVLNCLGPECKPLPATRTPTKILTHWSSCHTQETPCGSQKRYQSVDVREKENNSMSLISVNKPFICHYCLPAQNRKYIVSSKARLCVLMAASAENNIEHCDFVS